MTPRRGAGINEEHTGMPFRVQRSLWASHYRTSPACCVVDAHVSTTRPLSITQPPGGRDAGSSPLCCHSLRCLCINLNRDITSLTAKRVITGARVTRERFAEQARVQTQGGQCRFSSRPERNLYMTAQVETVLTGSRDHAIVGLITARAWRDPEYKARRTACPGARGEVRVLLLGDRPARQSGLRAFHHRLPRGSRPLSADHHGAGA